LLAEQSKIFEVKVKARARMLEEAHRRLAQSDFKTDPQECRAQLDRLLKRRDVLRGKPVDGGNPCMPGQARMAVVPRILSAAEDDELRVIENRIAELAKRVKQLQATGALPAA
jgi:hypothetical protein